MATETVASTQTSPVEEVKEKLNEEVQPTKQESGEQNPKAEDSPSVECSLAKTEEKTHKLIEEPPASVTTLSETEEKIEDKPTVAPVVEEVVMTEDIPAVDISVKESLEVAQDPVHELDTSSVPEVVVNGVESQPEQPANESVDKEHQGQPAIAAADIKQEEQPATESVNKEPEEQPNIVDVPTFLVESIEKPEEPLKVTPIKEPEAVTVIQREVVQSIKEEKPEPAVTEVVGEIPEPAVAEVEEKSDSAVPKVEEKPEPAVAEIEGKTKSTVPEVEEKSYSEVLEVEENPESAVAEVEEKPEAAVPEVEEKPGEQPIAVEIEKCEGVEPKGSVPGETEKEEVAFPDKLEDITILKEENISKDQEILASESSEQVVSTYQEVQADQQGDEGNPTPSIDEKIGAEIIEKEGSGTGVVEELSKEAALVELAKDEPIKVEDVNSAVCTADLTTSVEEESKSRDVELLAEDKKEDIKDEMPASVEANKEEATEEKLGENTTADNKQVVEPKESELEVKAEETVKAEADKLEKEEVGETVKSDVPNLEPSSEIGDATKSSEDFPEEVPAKPPHKQSNNILTKVKKSLVKAKKAILGKSPTSKTITAETKGEDIEVK